MVRHMVQLTKPQDEYITGKAKLLGISVSELVRRIVDEYIEGINLKHYWGTLRQMGEPAFSDRLEITTSPNGTGDPMPSKTEITCRGEKDCKCTS